MFTNRLVKGTFAMMLAVGVSGFTVANSYAGAVGGPKYKSTSVDPRSSDSYTIRFYGNEEAIVRIKGDGDTLLIAQVFDENGNLIQTDSDGDGTGLVLLKWTPRWTGNFIIRIVNRGLVYNNYVIETN